MDHHIGKIRFRSLKSDPFVYVYEDKNGSAILAHCVDDVLLLGVIEQLPDKLAQDTDYGPFRDDGHGFRRTIV